MFPGEAIEMPPYQVNVGGVQYQIISGAAYRDGVRVTNPTELNRVDAYIRDNSPGGVNNPHAKNADGTWTINAWPWGNTGPPQQQQATLTGVAAAGGSNTLLYVGVGLVLAIVLLKR